MISYLWNIDKQLLYEIDDSAVFGRVIEANIVLDDESLSRLHFKISYKKIEEDIKNIAGVVVEPSVNEFGFVIEDLNSSNGTKCNTYKIKEAVKLVAGDIIEAGSYRYMFLTLEAIKNNDKNSLQKLIPGFMPETFREEIKVKIFAFYKFVYEQMQLYLERRRERLEKRKIFDSRSAELGVLDQKKQMIDQKKQELDQMYAEKLKLINEKYKEVEEFRNQIFEKYKPSVEEQTLKIKALNNKLNAFQSEYFVGLYDEENDIDENK